MMISVDWNQAFENDNGRIATNIERKTIARELYIDYQRVRYNYYMLKNKIQYLITNFFAFVNERIGYFIRLPINQFTCLFIHLSLVSLLTHYYRYC